LALPTVGIFLGALAAFIASAVLAINHAVPRLVTIAVGTVVCVVMFMVMHDALHFAASRSGWVNGLIGRLALPFIAPLSSLSSYSYVHIEHHRHANDEERDPDTFVNQGHGWQLPVRLMMMDVGYTWFYLRKLPTRPKTEIVEASAAGFAAFAGLTAAVLTGNLWLLLVIYLIPQRIAMLLLAWGFDWLPHHGLSATQTENRYRATRLRVGMEWLLTPLTMSQNYHLIHHLHPSVPFYRYRAVWHRNQDAYLDHDPAINTVLGRSLTPDEFREWTELDSALLRLLPGRALSGLNPRDAVFHRLPVASVDPITADSVLVTFAVPEALRADFRFAAGQRVAVRTTGDGAEVWRNYSICAPATGPRLQIAVKRIPGGVFSTFVNERLRPGDVLEVMAPTGDFGTGLDPRGQKSQKSYAAIVAGSGITPVLSIVQTALEVEPTSRFTLIYGNRTRASTMFRGQLAELQARYAGRLGITDVLSRDPLHPRELRGRIDREKLERWLSTLGSDTVDEWFLCGPIELVTGARELLLERGVEPERIHVELFFANRDGSIPEYARAASVTFLLDGAEHTVELTAGESLLDAALRVRRDTPYTCMGGACGTCKAKLVAGSVEMEHDFALSRADQEQGYVLTCQAHPTSSPVRLDYDAKNVRF
jgi:ring-1,2-phenylacetyl-CoA epoxidase subunit PaaE